MVEKTRVNIYLRWCVLGHFSIIYWALKYMTKKGLLYTMLVMCSYLEKAVFGLNWSQGKWLQHSLYLPLHKTQYDWENATWKSNNKWEVHGQKASLEQICEAALKRMWVNSEIVSEQSMHAFFHFLVDLYPAHSLHKDICRLCGFVLMYLVFDFVGFLSKVFSAVLFLFFSLQKSPSLGSTYF